MKTIRLVLLAALVGMLLYGCATFKGGTVSVTPNPLEVHADSINATLRATIPPKSGIKKNTVVNSQLAIQNNVDSTRQYPVGSAQINTNDFPDIATVGASRTVKLATAFIPEMNNGTLVSNNSFTRGSKTTQLPKLKLSKCCITTSRLVQAATSPEALAQMLSMGGASGTRGMQLASGNQVNFRTPVNQTAKFQFPKNVFAIQQNQYKKEDIIAIGEFLKKKYNTTSVTIEGFASPEGAFRRNQFLALNRQREVQKWLTKQLKDAGYNNYLDSSFFKLSVTNEDWEGFKTSLDQTPYSEDVKRQIIEIISAGYDADEQERRVMTLVGGANRVESILAPLRRSTIYLQAEVVRRTEAQLDSLARGFANGTVPFDAIQKELSQDEFYFAAAKYANDPAGRAQAIALFEGYVKAYPDDYRGHNNLGVLYAQDAKLDKAQEHMTVADQKKPNDPMIINNLAMIALARGNAAEAGKLAEKSYQISKTPQAAFILGYREHKAGRYAPAVDYFTQAGDLPFAQYDNGLAKVLTNDLGGAKNALEAATRANAKDAWAYYVLAVIGARSGDTALMGTNLKQAVSLRQDLSKYAAEDLEFREYWSTAEFQTAVKTN